MLPPSEFTGVERALWAEEQGFDSLWIPDGAGKMHSLTLAGGLAAKTSSIRIGIGVVPVYTHTPAVLASAALTLSHLAPGRVVLGIGASSHTMIESWHGLPFEKPLTRVRETAQVLRRMLDGERVDYAGKTLSTKGFKLMPTPNEHIPIYLAALRPKMLELAGEIGDGVILHLAPLRALPKMLEHVARGAERSGRSLADLEIVCRFNTIVSDTREAGIEASRQFIQMYYTTPVYNEFLAWCGFEKQAALFMEGFQARDRAKTRAALDDELVSELCILGDAKECREQTAAFHAAGINTAAINAFAEDAERASRTMAAFSPSA